MHTCMQMHGYSNTCTCERIHTCARTYIHTHTHTHIYTHIHTHTHIHTYIHTYEHTYTHRHIQTHTHMHIHIHTHIHTRIHTLLRSFEFRQALRCLHTHMHTLHIRVHHPHNKHQQCICSSTRAYNMTFAHADMLTVRVMCRLRENISQLLKYESVREEHFTHQLRTKELENKLIDAKLVQQTGTHMHVVSE